MSSNHARPPGYDLEDVRTISSAQEIKAAFHPLRSTLLGLLVERAATVAELATAVDRPPSTVAYHVKVLADAGLVKVVHTRKVRAIEERSYGRTARIFMVGTVEQDQLADITNYLPVAAAESGPAHEADRLRAFLRYARISQEQAGTFWQRVLDLVNEFSQLARGGDETYGFVVGLYPTDHPSLPGEPPRRPRRRGGVK
jgi:DNA-binding transcriptional ArsR family regulator